MLKQQSAVLYAGKVRLGIPGPGILGHVFAAIGIDGLLVPVEKTVQVTVHHVGQHAEIAAFEFKEAADAVWLSEHPETGKKGAEKDPFFLILMQLRDEELARMPQDLAERLQTMSERGLAPKKLAERIRTLSQK